MFETIAAQKPTSLLIVADGPRNEAERALCEQTRAIVRVDWECAVETNYAKENMGCKTRVSSGLDWVFERAETAIILEDDCLPSPEFFPFREDMLERYRDDDRIMQITGTRFLPTDYQYSHFFDGVAEGKIDTWDVQWAVSCLSQWGLCVTPNANLIANIGFRGDATHTKDASPFLSLEWTPRPEGINPEFVFVDALQDAEFTRFFRTLSQVSFPVRVVGRLKRIVGRLNPKR